MENVAGGLAVVFGSSRWRCGNLIWIFSLQWCPAVRRKQGVLGFLLKSRQYVENETMP